MHLYIWRSQSNDRCIYNYNDCDYATMTVRCSRLKVFLNIHQPSQLHTLYINTSTAQFYQLRELTYWVAMAAWSRGMVILQQRLAQKKSRVTRLEHRYSVTLTCSWNRQYCCLSQTKELGYRSLSLRVVRTNPARVMGGSSYSCARSRSSAILQFCTSTSALLQVLYAQFYNAILQVQFFKLCSLNHRANACSCLL
jgi:hypothetical protein